MTWFPRLSILARRPRKSSMAIRTRLPGEAGLDILTGIAEMTRMAILINIRPWVF